MLNFKITGSVFAIKFFKIAQNWGHVSERVSQANASLADQSPTNQPTKPTKQTNQPTEQLTNQPTNQRTNQPTKPTNQPTNH